MKYGKILGKKYNFFKRKICEIKSYLERFINIMEMREERVNDFESR